MKKIGGQEVGWQYYVEAFPSEDFFMDGSLVWEPLGVLPKFLSKKLNGISHKAEIHKTAQIENSIISENCKIGEFVSIRDSYIGPSTVVGHSCEIARSIVLSNSGITHFCYVGDTIIGNFVLLSGGVRTGNRRLDSRKIAVKILEETYNTGSYSFGGIIGDNSILGGGVHTNPGTLVGKNVTVFPGVELLGFIPSNSTVKTKKPFTVEPKKPRK